MKIMLLESISAKSQLQIYQCQNTTTAVYIVLAVYGKPELSLDIIKFVIIIQLKQVTLNFCGSVHLQVTIDTLSYLS